MPVNMLMGIIVVLVAHQVATETTTQTGMRNKHLKIEGIWWGPFLNWECPGGWNAWEDQDYDCPGNRTSFDGTMGKFLNFMQHERNFSFTFTTESSEWGKCHSINNCTGMIGRVNRKEVDFALGRPKGIM